MLYLLYHIQGCGGFRAYSISGAHCHEPERDASPAQGYLFNQ